MGTWDGIDRRREDRRHPTGEVIELRREVARLKAKLDGVRARALEDTGAVVIDHRWVRDRG